MAGVWLAFALAALTLFSLPASAQRLSSFPSTNRLALTNLLPVIVQVNGTNQNAYITWSNFMVTLTNYVQQGSNMNFTVNTNTGTLTISSTASGSGSGTNYIALTNGTAYGNLIMTNDGSGNSTTLIIDDTNGSPSIFFSTNGSLKGGIGYNLASGGYLSIAGTNGALAYFLYPSNNAFVPSVDGRPLGLGKAISSAKARWMLDSTNSSVAARTLILGDGTNAPMVIFRSQSGVLFVNDTNAVTSTNLLTAVGSGGSVGNVLAATSTGSAWSNLTAFAINGFTNLPSGTTTNFGTVNGGTFAAAQITVTNGLTNLGAASVAGALTFSSGTLSNTLTGGTNSVATNFLSIYGTNGYFTNIYAGNLQSITNMTDTWNDSTILFSGIKKDVTMTAAPTNSKVLYLTRDSGVPIFEVLRDGTTFIYASNSVASNNFARLSMGWVQSQNAFVIGPQKGSSGTQYDVKFVPANNSIFYISSLQFGSSVGQKMIYPVADNFYDLGWFDSRFKTAHFMGMSNIVAMTNYIPRNWSNVTWAVSPIFTNDRVRRWVEGEVVIPSAGSIQLAITNGAIAKTLCLGASGGNTTNPFGFWLGATNTMQLFTNGGAFTTNVTMEPK